MTDQSMGDRDWSVLLRALRQGNCVLLLGSEVADARGTSAQERLAEELAMELARPPVDAGNLAHVAQAYVSEFDRDYLESEVERHYRGMADQEAESSPLKSLAELPFPLIVTSRHDQILEHALAKVGRPPKVEYYHFRGGGKDYVDEGTVESPLLYSMHGHLQDISSLVVTEDDLLDFLAAVLGKNPALPANIRSELSNPRRSFLFLGFGLRHWYLRILLHALRGSGTERRSFAMEEFRDATPKDVEEAVYFWGRGHKIHLFQQDVNGFIAELHTRWKQEGGELSVSRASLTAASPGDDRPRVFLSYASQDQLKVGWVRDGLRERGLDPWMDTEGLRGGDDWANVLQTSVEACDYFVLCQSHALTQRTFSYVHKEIEYARHRQSMAAESVRFMVPVLLDDVAPMPKLSDIQSMKLHEDTDLDRLVKVLKRDFARRKRL